MGEQVLERRRGKIIKPSNLKCLVKLIQGQFSREEYSCEPVAAYHHGSLGEDGELAGGEGVRQPTKGILGGPSSVFPVLDKYGMYSWDAWAFLKGNKRTKGREVPYEVPQM